MAVAKRRVAVGVVAALMMLCGAGAGAADRVFSIGVEALDYLPAYGVQDGQYVGFARELLDAFAKERGYRFDYKPLPVPRLYATFFEGQVDFKYPDNPNWQAEQRAGKKIVYSAPVMAFIDGTLVRADAKDLTTSDIKTLGTVVGFSPWPWLDSVKKGQVVVRENRNFTALTQQVLTKRIDAAYGSVAVLNFQLDQVLKSPGALVFNPRLPHTKDNYFLSTVRHPELITEFNAWLKERQELVQKLKKQHGVEKGING